MDNTLSYVKFKCGLLSDFNKLSVKDTDTLYFVYESEDKDTADLYWGSRKISSGINTESGGSHTPLSLKDLTDTLISEDIDINHILVYNGSKWINQSIEQIFSPVIKVITNVNNENTHDDLAKNAFASQDEPAAKNGDIVIIKDFTDDNVHKHTTSYIYDSSNWIAMNGNYDANNIYFDNDFIITENIGTIQIPKDEGFVRVSANGKNLKEFLSSIFAAEKGPNVTSPSAELILTHSGAYEVGTECSTDYSIKFKSGSYEYGPENTEVTATYEVTDGKSVLTTQGGDFGSFTVQDDTNYKLTATVTSTDGVIPNSNLGNPWPEAKILADTFTVTSASITGYRKLFYGALDSKDTYDIRSLSFLTKKQTFNIDLNEDTFRVVIAYPKTWGLLTSVLDENDAYTNIKSGFGEPEEVDVLSASNDPDLAMTYYVYTMDFAKTYGTKNRFKVTI